VSTFVREEETRQVLAFRERQVVRYQIPGEHFCQEKKEEAGVYQKRRQVSVEHVCGITKAALSRKLHHSHGLMWLVERAENDGLGRRAGDGTRTRDILLGRQTFPRSTRYAPESALQADPGVFIVNRATKTYTVPRKFGDAEHRRSLC
jgi:hypothetical protein